MSITPERLVQYKKQALSSVAARAKNPTAEPGVAMVCVSPHDLLDLVLSFEQATQPEPEKQQ